MAIATPFFVFLFIIARKTWEWCELAIYEVTTVYIYHRSLWKGSSFFKQKSQAAEHLNDVHVVGW